MKPVKLIIDEKTYLALRQPKDAPAVFAQIEKNRTYLKEWLPWLNYNTAVADSLQHIEQSIAKWNKKQALDLGIWYEEQFVGMVSLNTLDWQTKQTTIGYWISEAGQGKGIITKSCQALITFAFEELGMEEIIIRAAVGNVKSQGIPERLGFVKQGLLPNAQKLYGRTVDLIVYQLKKGSK